MRSSKPKRTLRRCLWLLSHPDHGPGVKVPLKLKDDSLVMAWLGDSVMSACDFLKLAVGATLIALAAAVHSPYGESLATVWASMGLVK
jgi:hypothetical protein